MAAPKGNKYSVGNSGGKPKYDLKKEADKLLKWSLLQDSINLHGFTDDKDYCTEQLREFAKQSEVFSSALIKAKNRIALRRENSLNKDTLHQVAFAKSAHVYDCLSRKQSSEELDEAMKREMKRDEHREKIKMEAEAKRGIPPGQPKIDETIAEAKGMNVPQSQTSIINPGS